MESSDETCCQTFRWLYVYHWRGLLSFFLPIFLLPVLFSGSSTVDRVYWTFYVFLVIAAYWLTDCMPTAVASLVPIVILPVMGIQSSPKTCQQYFTDPVAYFTGGLMVGLAVLHSNLHERMLVGVIYLFGCTPKRILFSIMLVSFFLSMWISNSVTVALMCPVVESILTGLQEQNVIPIYMTDAEEVPKPDGKKHASRICIGFYLGLAFAATLGGCVSLLGSPTNLAFKGLYDLRFVNRTNFIEFPEYTAFSFPWVLIAFIITFLSLAITNMGLLAPNSGVGQANATALQRLEDGKKVLSAKYDALTGINIHLVQVVVAFLIMLGLLITMNKSFDKSWLVLADFEKPVSGSSITMSFALVLFYLPASYKSLKYFTGSGPYTTQTTPACLPWKFVHTNFVWTWIFAMGAGLTLEKALLANGTGKEWADGFSSLSSMPPFAMKTLVVLGVVFITCFTSNLLVCNIVMPFIMEMAVAVKVHPLYLMFPACWACSVSFLLPISTPTNKIICEFAYIRRKYVLVAGIIPTIVCIVLILLQSAYHPYVYTAIETYPDWAV